MLVSFAFKPCCLSALLLVAATITPTHAANVCDPAYQAGIKSIQTPHHVYSVTTTQGKAQSGEAIYSGGVEYLQLNGQWKRSPMSQQDMLEPAREKLKTHPDVCTVMGDQGKDGQATTLYEVHNTELGVDQQVWIAKSTGLMVHVTATFGAGNATDVRYDYGNVQPPAGVQ